MQTLQGDHLDQSTGEFTGNEPLATLATYRAEGPSVTFGQHMMAEASGSIGIGDLVVIAASHERLP